MMQSHFSLIWESVADAIPEHVALIQGERRISWRDYEDRAARLAPDAPRAGARVQARVQRQSRGPASVQVKGRAHAGPTGPGSE